MGKLIDFPSPGSLFSPHWETKKRKATPQQSTPPIRPLVPPEQLAELRETEPAYCATMLEIEALPSSGQQCARILLEMHRLSRQMDEKLALILKSSDPSRDMRRNALVRSRPNWL